TREFSKPTFAENCTTDDRLRGSLFGTLADGQSMIPPSTLARKSLHEADTVLLAEPGEGVICDDRRRHFSSPCALFDDDRHGHTSAMQLIA
ncbi:hypothetical protein, partial [Sphingobium yanoikuyae]|uniref:hypothetical protein n=1 Tax=Sphingobium yanoikuyae TaxID=13690 RepID=UPI002FDDBC59